MCHAQMLDLRNAAMPSENVTNFPAASVLGFPADCYVLQRVLAEVCAAHPSGPLHVIETGACDGGSSFLLLLANPRVHLLSMTWPGSRGAQAHENRELSHVGSWALPRLAPEVIERWRVVARDSTIPGWPEFLESLGEGEWGVPRFVFLDGSHARDDVLAELRNVCALESPPVVMVHDAETDGVQQALRQWEAEGGGTWSCIEGTKLARAAPHPHEQERPLARQRAVAVAREPKGQALTKWLFADWGGNKRHIFDGVAEGLRGLGVETVRIPRNDMERREELLAAIEGGEHDVLLTWQRFYPMQKDILGAVARSRIRTVFMDFGFQPHYQSVVFDTAVSSWPGHVEQGRHRAGCSVAWGGRSAHAR